MKPDTTIYWEYSWMTLIAGVATCITVGQSRYVCLFLLIIVYVFGMIIIKKELEKLKHEIRETNAGKPL